MAKEKFDYSKVSHDSYMYYGFHLKNGRYHIDTKRIIKLGYKSSFPEALFNKPRSTHYFEPYHKYSNEYAVNVLIYQLNKLTDDWNNEYKVALSKLMTPDQVKNQYRLDQIAYTSDPDDLNEIEIDAMFAGIRRQTKYNEVVKSIHLQYLQKIFTDFFRAILIVIKDRGYVNDFDFGYKSFCLYVQKISNANSNKRNPLYGLPHYKYFDILNKIDNFLKHNTRMAYMAIANNSFEKDERLKEFQSQFVYSVQEVKCEYENGMYAGDWLKIDANFVDEILINLKEFSKELCQLLYDEDYNDAWWNSDEELINILRDNFFDLF